VNGHDGLHGLGFLSREKDGVRLFRTPRPGAGAAEKVEDKRPRSSCRNRKKKADRRQPTQVQTPQAGQAKQAKQAKRVKSRDYSDSPFAVLKQLMDNP